MRGLPLRLLFGPAIYLMNRLRYAPKFVVIGLFLLIPVTSVFWLQYRDASDSVAFNRKKLIGAEYLSGTEEFFFALQGRRILAVAVSAGATFMQPELAAATERTDRAAAELGRLDQKYGADDAKHLGTTPLWTEIRESWETLRQTTPASPDDIDAAHQHLAWRIKDELMLLACNRSNLILDPYPSSYWLVEGLALKLPAIADSLTAAATRGIIPAGEGMADRLIELAGLRYHALLSLTDLESKNLEMAFEDDRVRHGNDVLRWALQVPFHQLSGQVTEQLEILKRHYFPVPAGSLPAIREAAEQTQIALAQSREFFHAIRPHLDKIIVERIHYFERQRLFGILFSSLAGLFVVYLFTGFYLSVRTSIAALSKATTRMIQGTSERFELESRDELGQMAESYNRINTVLLQARTLLEHSPDGIAVARAGQLVYVNPQMLSLLGYDRSDELFGRNATDILGPENGFSADGRLVERRYLRRDGAKVEVEVASHDILFEGAPAVMAIVREITERKRNEEIIADQRIRNARAAGRAEIATAVLHNVGNVLNSVNVSIGICSEEAKRSKTPGLSKAVALMRSHAPDLGAFLASDPQGRHLPQYLEVLAEQLGREQQLLQGELGALQKNVSHLTTIVAAQQSFAKSAGASEAALPSEVFREALMLTSDRFERHGIRLVTEFESTPLAILERHKVIQILVNLLNNAVQAITERGEDRELILRISKPEPERISFSVKDNGIGISPENKIRIFSHGFTTKKDGHGFGLHASACFASEMGGALTCYSEGLGRGSTFFLELPFIKADAHRDYKLSA